MNILAISVAAIFVLSQHGSGKPNQVDKTEQYIQELNDALALARDEKCAQALDQMLPALQSPSYETLTEESKILIYETVLNCEIDERRWTEALDAIEALIRLRGETARLLWLKVVIGDIADQPLASFDATER